MFLWLKSFLSVVLAAIIPFGFNMLTLTSKTQVIAVNEYETAQTFETFGTSSAWWAQTIDEKETAKEIARLLYDKETGLGLDIFRYNIGGGEAENPETRIWDTTRRTESFYVFNEETGEYEYDFTRDKNARQMLDAAIEYGASEVILFCNSPHFSMTKSGHASGALTADTSNLPKENYQAFVDYVLTIADWFAEQGYPVTAISPINEPQWSWGGEWVGQEGCHYTTDEAVAVLELFAKTMAERGCTYKLSGPESGQMDAPHYELIDKFFANETLNSVCASFAGHSYWLDGNKAAKAETGKKFKEQYPDKKFEMSEWCELPLKIDSTTIDSGIHMANVIIEDLNLLNAVSWQSWTAVNGDGLMEIKDGELVIYNRYYAFKQFTSFIEAGMTRISVLDSFEENSQIASTAFTNGEKTVIVLINNAENEQSIRLWGCYNEMEIHRTDKDTNCEKVFDGTFEKNQTLPARSITTFVLEK